MHSVTISVLRAGSSFHCYVRSTARRGLVAHGHELYGDPLDLTHTQKQSDQSRRIIYSNQTMSDSSVTNAFWGRERLREALTSALLTLGLDPTATDLTVDDLAPIDQFHGGGISSTRRLASLVGHALLGANVVDVGGGFGGPARVLAAENGCIVTSVDLTESYIATGAWLTGLSGLQAKVSHVVGDALTLPVNTASADVVWMQNAAMNISDKVKLYSEVRRVLRPGGIFVFQEPMAGCSVETPDSETRADLIYPVMWADTADESFLCTPIETQRLLLSLGFSLRVWDDCSEEIGGTTSGKAPHAGVSIQQIIKGAAKLKAIVDAGRINKSERRLVMVQAIFDVRS